MDVGCGWGEEFEDEEDSGLSWDWRARRRSRAASRVVIWL